MILDSSPGAGHTGGLSAEKRNGMAVGNDNVSTRHSDISLTYTFTGRTWTPATSAEFLSLATRDS